MEEPFLIVGLGNPGSEYAHTRHNAGFMVVDKLASLWGAGWQNSSPFQCKLAKVEWQGIKGYLCQPVTYMNSSGESVGPLARYYKVPLQRVWVVVDDADLPFGEIRVRASGSPGGHHGLESIERHLGTREYPRQRIGIGRRSADQRQIRDYVLGRFDREETAQLEKILDRGVQQVECWLRHGILKAMSQFNGVVIAPSEKDKK